MANYDIYQSFIKKSSSSFSDIVGRPNTFPIYYHLPGREETLLDTFVRCNSSPCPLDLLKYLFEYKIQINNELSNQTTLYKLGNVGTKEILECVFRDGEYLLTNEVC